ncbi:MAG: hypothetical protein K9N09_05900 [Candidatus Cloacimonetes bacterium]|nr:hypothetical protein [Candidatus Cloacimonadota bacterium]MCF7813585.1 hypothetical protein [Candidatus Cloacimonadota bacterium]MCF7868216.1 hypothetical protein [Candidatus Cloacimonadota bacterium]MCF7883620.1 hypothetical protein [Candidatus Cloacimonadota bacterium]
MKNLKLYLALSFVVLLLFTGCANMKTSKKQFVGTDEKLIAQDYEGVLKQIQAAKGKFYKKKEQALFYLDEGMLLHYAGRYKESNEALSKAEQAIDELYTKSISRAATSMLFNDNTLEYAGEDYEDIYLNVFKALNYLELNQFDAAFVEIRRINDKLSLLEQKHKKTANQLNLSKDKKNEFKTGKNKFHNSALGRYLSMLLYRAEGKMDDARIDRDKIVEAFNLQAQVYDFKHPNLDSYLERTEKAKVNFISFVGRGPDKKANTLYIHTEKDLIIIGTTEENPRGNQQLETLDIINWPGVKEGYHFKFQLPYMEMRKSKIGNVKIVVDNRDYGYMEKIESIEKVALETYKIKEPIIYLKTITRAVIKGLAAEKGKEELDKQVGGGGWGDLLRLATDVAVDQTENADLRISRFFPAKALVDEIELAPGTHHIKLEYYDKNGNLLWIDDKGVKEVSRKDMNLFESYYLN